MSAVNLYNWFIIEILREDKKNNLHLALLIENVDALGKTNPNDLFVDSMYMAGI